MILGWALPGAGLLSRSDPLICPSEPGPDPCLLSRVTFGQAIYTPATLFSELPPITDRPYAGWLFMDAVTAKVTPNGMTSLGVQVGVTGDPSFAGSLHRWFHRSLGKHEAMGWERQIPFEFAFAFEYENRRAWPIVAGGGKKTLHIEPRGSLTLGTLRLGGLAGLSLRAGWNAPPSMDWRGVGPGSPYLILALGADGELVLRDLFLDGSTWAESARSERVPLVGRLNGRIQAGVGGFGLEFAVTRSSRQFLGQEGAHTVGTLRAIIRP